MRDRRAVKRAGKVRDRARDRGAVKRAGKPRAPRQAQVTFGKGVATLHTPPEDVSTSLMSVLLMLLGQAYELGAKLPDTSWPIHVSVEMGGQKACGTVEPSGPA